MTKDGVVGILALDSSLDLEAVAVAVEGVFARLAPAGTAAYVASTSKFKRYCELDTITAWR
jgi:hypothetical protein